MRSLTKCGAWAWVLLSGATAAAQTGAADRCMMMPTDAERLECMRAALNEAERRLGGSGDGTTSAANATPAESGAPARGARDGLAALGAERASETRDDRRYQATIVNVREGAPGRMRFELDNGQVWQQTEADSQRLSLRSGAPVSVELWSTWSGGYRMLLPGERRVVRVERVR